MVDENMQVRLSDADSAELLNDDGSKLGNSVRDKYLLDMEMMNERFAKLLLGEDMSGGGIGVASALALSNAFTNLAASVFGEQSKLEPMSEERKARWRKETGWLLSVTDYIVEFVPCQQKSKDGSSMEVMMTQQRSDILTNIPALRKIDEMLIGTLDNFSNQQEFRYVSRNADDSEKGVQKDDKWWLPTIKVPPNGLSDEVRQFLQLQKESVVQALKEAMFINAQILSDMEIPENYLETLPKHGKSSLGDAIYKNITDDFFDPQQFLSTLDLSSEHKVVDLKNRIEASIVIWQRKLHHKEMKSTWGLANSSEKRELFEERAETILLLLKHEFPGLPQSSLDISKIEYNRDVGLAVLESYSRVLETLANTVMSRIDDVLYADSVARDPSAAVRGRHADDDTPSPTVSSCPSPNPSVGDDHEPGKLSSAEDSTALSDFMGWESDPPEKEITQSEPPDKLESSDNAKEEPAVNSTIMRYFYMDKGEAGGLKSPVVRH